MRLHMPQRYCFGFGPGFFLVAFTNLLYYNLSQATMTYTIQYTRQNGPTVSSDQIPLTVASRLRPEAAFRLYGELHWPLAEVERAAKEAAE